MNELLRASRLMPLITLRSEESMEVVGEVIKRSKVKFIEVAYRSEYASEAIKKYSNLTDKIVGAGTVKNVAQAKIAVDNGAQFIVSPGLSAEVLEFGRDSGIPVYPGVLTPSEILYGMNKFDLSVFKVFPANLLEGVRGINALSAPFYDAEFLPTGGVNTDNYLEYLSNKQIIAVGGSFIINDGISQNEIENEINKVNKLVESAKNA